MTLSVLKTGKEEKRSKRASNRQPSQFGEHPLAQSRPKLTAERVDKSDDELLSSIVDPDQQAKVDAAVLAEELDVVGKGIPQERLRVLRVAPSSAHNAAPVSET